MGIVVQVAKLVAKYGTKAVQWVWNNTTQIFDWAARGLTAWEISEIIGGMF